MEKGNKMAIVLRLTGLNVHSGSKDIRKFFDTLEIPDGGVYILGGRMGEAFVVFTSEKDGHLAMHKSGTFLRGSQISLYISSTPELQHRMEVTLQKSKLLNSEYIKEPLPTIAEPAPLRHLGLISTFEVRHPAKEKVLPSACLFSTSSAITPVNLSYSEMTSDSNPGYVRLYGLSASVTKQDICSFFRGLPVQEVIVNAKIGPCRCCLVKFADLKNANNALGFDHHEFGSRIVDIRGASERMWISAVQECDNTPNKHEEMLYKSSQDKNNPKIRPLFDSVIPWLGDRTLHNYNMATYKQVSPQELCYERPFRGPSLSQGSKRPRSDSKYPTHLQGAVGYSIMATNLSPEITKTEIKDLFKCEHIPNNKILHLLDTKRMRTDTAFIIFNQLKDYQYAMNLNGCRIGPEAIFVSPVTRAEMKAMLSGSIFMDLKQGSLPTSKTRSCNNIESNAAATAPTCLYVRNLPADVGIADIKNLFYQFRLVDELIVLLKTKDGNGIGEAVVQFKTDIIAARARKLHGRTFMGTSVLLTLINCEQMMNILQKN